MRTQILHLGFEDPRRPGSGGGSVRTHEVNRRLAARHQITVVTAKFPGWRGRIEDGVRYLHAGVEAGYVRSGQLLPGAAVAGAPGWTTTCWWPHDRARR